MITDCVLGVSEIRECEKYTLEALRISSKDLMEQAGIALAEEIQEYATLHSNNKIMIFCGPGNNGGDGAVIARTLIYKHNYSGDITVIDCSQLDSKTTNERQENVETWKELTKTHTNANYCIYSSIENLNIEKNVLVVDALFGIGLNKPLSGIYKNIVSLINNSDSQVISIDIPSGMYVDSHTPKENLVIISDLTLTVQSTKLALLLPENYFYFGEVKIVDVGIIIPDEISKSERRRLITPALFGKNWDFHENAFAHKGTFGHGLLIAGSKNMPGAAVISATAAMRGGIGKLTIHSASSNSTILACTIPEAIFDPDEREDCVSKLDWDKLSNTINAIAIGPGIGKSSHTLSLLKDILDTINSPIILDADALNLFSENKTRLAFLPQNSILTPHFKEFERLAGIVDNDFDRLEKAKAFAIKHSVILVLKGHHTCICTPDGSQYFNTTGNSGMATAGSGDVLTGLLLSFLAQGFTPIYSALLAVYIHGAAGDAYANVNNKKTLIASDLPKYFNFAFNYLSYCFTK